MADDDGGIDITFGDLADDHEAAAVAPDHHQAPPEAVAPTPRLTLADIVSDRKAAAAKPSRLPEAVLSAVPLAGKKAAPQPVSARLTDTDFEFLGSLSNEKKVRKQRNADAYDDEFLGAHDDLDMYDEGDAEAEMQRLHRLREEADDERLHEAEEELAPIDVGDEAADDEAVFAEVLQQKRTKKTKKPRRRGKKDDYDTDADEETEVSSRTRDRGLRGDPFGKEVEPPRRKTRAEMILEEINHKSKRIARIEQLESRGIICPLPKGIDRCSLPLSQIDSAWSLMEVKHARKAKILKMRAGFFFLNKALVWGATSHPGPEFLKFYKVRGFDKVIADEIDDFDDDLEKLWDMWFGDSGEMHPLLSIAFLEGTMLANHIMRQSGDLNQAEATLKTVVDGQKSAASTNAGSTTSLLTNLMGMLGNLGGGNDDAAPAAPSAPRQPAPSPPVNPFQTTNYGQPPPVEITREFQRREKEISNLQARLEEMSKQKTSPEEDTEMMRLLLDEAVDLTENQQQPSSISEIVEDDIVANDPLDVIIEEDAPKKKSRRRRAKR